MALMRYEPLNLLNQLQREVNRLFDTSRFGDEETGHMLADLMPAVDIKEEPTQFVIHADLPGVDLKDIEVTLEAVYEFYMRGFSFAPIDLYKSDAAKVLIVDEKTLRPPFVAISGLGETAAVDLMRCRDSGREFISIEELSAACPKVSQTHIEILKSMGALGEMPDSSQITLFDM